MPSTVSSLARSPSPGPRSGRSPGPSSELSPASPLADRASGRAELRLERRADGSLWAVRGGAARRVQAVRCFPWSAPDRFISLRDPDGEELAFVEDPADLAPASRVALDAALVESGFSLDIERVLEVDEEVEIRTWSVLTRQGPRRFQTARDHWPRELPGGGLLIRDVAGDLYIIRDLAALDEASRAVLWAFVG